MSPTVSVVIPAYNSSRYISETIDSVLGQTYKDYEIIVIDDGSKDNTRDVLDRYIATDKIRYLYKENGGVSSAYNKGIRESLGKYIALLDADDLWLPEKLELQMEIMEKNPDIAMVHSDTSVIDSSGNLLKYSVNSKRQSHNGMVFEEFFRSYRALALLSASLIRKECFNKVGAFDEGFMVEDYYFLLCLSWHYPIYFINKPLTKYRIVKGSLSRANPMRLINNHEAIIKKFISEHRDFFEKNPDLLKEKWDSFNLESAFLLFHKGDFKNSHVYFKKALRPRADVWIYYLATSMPQGLLMLLRRIKRSVF